MSYLIAAPQALTAAAGDLANIGSAVQAAKAAAAAPTTGVLAAGADEVSAAIAEVFGAHAQAFQGASAQAAAFHEQFVQALTAGAGAYASAEAAAAQALPGPLQNSALSVSGFQVWQSGTATATSGVGDISFAMGPGSNASSLGSVLAFSNAIGTNATAQANGTLNFATAIGTNSTAFTSTLSPGILQNAFVHGTNSSAITSGGFSDTASVWGSNSGALAGLGNINSAAVFGTLSGATAGGNSFATGSFNMATVVGNNSGAIAGPIGLLDSNFNVANIMFANNSNALAGNGSVNLATIMGGTGELAQAGGNLLTGTPGNFNLAAVLGFLGNNLTAIAQGTAQFVIVP